MYASLFRNAFRNTCERERVDQNEKLNDNTEHGSQVILKRASDLG